MITILYIAHRVFCYLRKSGPRPIVICGPSGSGKSTMLKQLFEEYPNTFGFSVSHTTRQPRSGEENGVHYYFVTRQEMQDAIDNDEFIEWAVFNNNMYGTSKQAIRQVQMAGKVCILDIEPQGVEQLKKSDLNPILIYNHPPSVEVLEERLRRRKTETEASLRNRLKAAKTEIAYGLTPGNFHKIIYNTVLEEAYIEFRNYILNELKAQQASGITICW